MKSDISIFSTYYLGWILAIAGGITGFFIMLGNATLGLIIVIVSIVIGKYLMFKARRRKGHILYDGGRI